MSTTREPSECLVGYGRGRATARAAVRGRIRPKVRATYEDDQDAHPDGHTAKEVPAASYDGLQHGLGVPVPQWLGRGWGLGSAVG